MKGAAKKIGGKTVDVHRHVRKKLVELRGSMSISDFAKKNGAHVYDVVSFESGDKIPCLYALKFLALRNGMRVEDFFPNGKIPDDYPTY